MPRARSAELSCTPRELKLIDRATAPRLSSTLSRLPASTSEQRWFRPALVDSSRSGVPSVGIGAEIQVGFEVEHHGIELRERQRLLSITGGLVRIGMNFH